MLQTANHASAHAFTSTIFLQRQVTIQSEGVPDESSISAKKPRAHSTYSTYTLHNNPAVYTPPVRLP